MVGIDESSSHPSGFWCVSADGGVFSSGGAPFLGSLAGHSLNAPISGIAGTDNGLGYRLVGADNGIFTFGNAGFFGPDYCPGLPLER